MILELENAFILILFISYIRYVASKQCFGPRVVKQDFGARLKGHAYITTKKYGAKVQCIEECLARNGHCVSINLNQRASLCELNDKTKSSVPLTADPEFVYTDMEEFYFLIGKCAKHVCPRDERCAELPNGSPWCFRMYFPCNSNPCLNSATCINDGTTYTCECPEKYSGSHCEILEPPWISFGKSIYLIVEQKKSWKDAKFLRKSLKCSAPPDKICGSLYNLQKAYCESKQAKLVEIETQEENTFIKNTLIQRNGRKADIRYWTGGNDLLVEGEYEWASSRQKIGHTDWAPLEPFGGASANCIEIMYLDAWGDTSCVFEEYFLCENQ